MGRKREKGDRSECFRTLLRKEEWDRGRKGEKVIKGRGWREKCMFRNTFQNGGIGQGKKGRKGNKEEGRGSKVNVLEHC